MKIRFKQYPYQLAAVDAVVDCFAGQPFADGIQYRVDPGYITKGQTQVTQQEGAQDDGFRNAPLLLKTEEILDNIQKVQQQQYLKISDKVI